MGELEVGEGVGSEVGAPVVGDLEVGFLVGDLVVGELEVGACEGEVVEVPVTHTHIVLRGLLHCPGPSPIHVDEVDWDPPASAADVARALVNWLHVLPATPPALFVPVHQKS